MKNIQGIYIYKFEDLCFWYKRLVHCTKSADYQRSGMRFEREFILNSRFVCIEFF